MNAETYVAFLRGINVGGNAIIKMSELKRAFETLGLENVTTVLASGNVVFDCREDPSGLKQRIEAMLSRRCRIQAAAILRRRSRILELIKSDPFKTMQPTSRAKFHVTFLTEEAKGAATFTNILRPKEFQIVQISGGEVCSAVEISGNAGTPELMRRLEKEFGKTITTRTWNTIERIGKIL